MLLESEAKYHDIGKNSYIVQWRIQNCLEPASGAVTRDDIDMSAD